LHGVCIGFSIASRQIEHSESLCAEGKSDDAIEIASRENVREFQLQIDIQIKQMHTALNAGIDAIFSKNCLPAAMSSTEKPKSRSLSSSAFKF
jgi:hypothetical protein